MSYEGQVIADSTGEWIGNEIRFGTREEAEGYVRNVSINWTLVRETQVVETTDPVTHMLLDGMLIRAIDAA